MPREREWGSCWGSCGISHRRKYYSKELFTVLAFTAVTNVFWTRHIQDSIRSLIFIYSQSEFRMLSHSLLWHYIFLLKRINQSQKMQVTSRVPRAFLQSWKSSCQLYFSPYIPHLRAWLSILTKRLNFRPSFFSKRRRKSKDSRDQGFAKRCLRRWKFWKH